MRRFNDRIASFGAAVFDRMTSEISRLSAISSLQTIISNQGSGIVSSSTYKLLLVAFSICSSKAVLEDEDHQLIILDSRGAAATGQANDEMQKEPESISQYKK